MISASAWFIVVALTAVDLQAWIIKLDYNWVPCNYKIEVEINKTKLVKQPEPRTGKDGKPKFELIAHTFKSQIQNLHLKLKTQNLITSIFEDYPKIWKWNKKKQNKDETKFWNWKIENSRVIYSALVRPFLPILWP